jgi:hypothetical protein
VRAIFAADAAARESWLDRRMQMQIPGYILKWDESFKTAKVIKLGSEQPFASIVLVMNGEHVIIAFMCTEDQSQESLEPVLQGVASRIVQFGLEPPRVLYTDRCCHDRALVTRVFPSLNDARGNVEGACAFVLCLILCVMYFYLYT